MNAAEQRSMAPEFAANYRVNLRNSTLRTRHRLVWAAPRARAGLMRQARDPDAQAALDMWLSHAWPFIVRRLHAPAEPADTSLIAIGLPLPPSRGKRRLSFILPRADIGRHAPPPALGEIARALPPAWQRPLASLDEAALRVGARFRVFGSAAWQALTGLDYLQADSDLDLVLRPIDSDEIAAATEILERWEAAEGRRADVEIVFPREDAVAWREWTNRDASVLLVKNPERVALVRRAELVARLATSAATA